MRVESAGTDKRGVTNDDFNESICEKQEEKKTTTRRRTFDSSLTGIVSVYFATAFIHIGIMIIKLSMDQKCILRDCCHC